MASLPYKKAAQFEGKKLKNIKTVVRTIMVAAGTVCLGVGAFSQTIAPARAAIALLDDDAYDIVGTAQDGFNITRDVDNGLDWLDFSLTTGRSYANVFADLGSGGDLEGWRFATEAEFLNLAVSAGIPGSHIDALGSLPAPPNLVALTNAFGITDATFSGSFAIFNEISATDPTHLRLGAMILNICEDTCATFDAPNDPVIAANQEWGKDVVDITVGSALVRDVPEPASMLLLAVGLAGLAGIRRRRITG